MNVNNLNAIVTQLVLNNKGILAADESDNSIKKRFDSVEIPSTSETHRVYRELLVTTEEIENYISGVILFDETFRQKVSTGVTFPQYLLGRGILPGIKVDLGTTELPETYQEKITLGLDNLQVRLFEYKNLGAKFAKWRAVFKISSEVPTEYAIEENARVLAEYALICQRADIVPIVEPEVLMEGDHTQTRCREITTKVQKSVFMALEAHGVFLEGMLLKSNMVVPGVDSTERVSAVEVATQTIETLKETVPPQVSGIVFLSGGEEPEQALDYLSHMRVNTDLPWPLSFSFGRALQEEALHLWAGDNTRVKDAQTAFLNRVQLTHKAMMGEYKLEEEVK